MKTKVTFNGDNTQVEFPDEEVTVDLAVTRVGKGLYRLDNVPFFVEAAGFGDVIEADRLVNGVLRFRRVVEKSKWKIYDYIMSQEGIASPAVKRVMERVTEVGGHWENVFGGCLVICLPSDCDYNPETDLTA